VFHFDSGGNMLAETDGDGAVLQEFVFLNGLPLATLEQGEVYYHHHNQIGAPQKLTDAAQQIAWRGDYLPFGEVVSVTSTVDNPIRFPGQYEEPNTGLSYNYFRSYDPSIGRYTQSDPIGLEAGTNTYSYVLANPNVNVDPLGLITCNKCSKSSNLGTDNNIKTCSITCDCQCDGKSIGRITFELQKGNASGNAVCPGQAFDHVTGILSSRHVDDFDSDSLFDKIFGDVPNKVMKDLDEEKCDDCAK